MKKVAIVLPLLTFLIYQFYSCGNNPGALSDKQVKEGYELSKKYCASCHQYPEPSLLNKTTWEKYILPKMAPYLGFELFANAYTASDTGIGLKMEQWNSIYKYYVSQAPDEPLKRDKDIGNIVKETPLFEELPLREGIQSPSTTLVVIDSFNKRILFGDGLTEKLFIMSSNLNTVDSIKVGVGISNIAIKDSSLWMLTMGIMHPADDKAGKLVVANLRNTNRIQLFDSLQRPVFAAYADLNNDGKEDIIISEFGDKYGSLSWMENLGDNEYRKHILRGLPGSIKTVVRDIDHDGRPDIVALMAQGDEGMFIYYNEGNGSFKEKRILRFPPSYGSNYFELADFNNDGYPDIITTNGDNGDYPPILKAYHGIRIFLNNGKNEFEEKLFLPVNGVGKVVARDFDQDGDLDLASIAYFADFRNNPSESFIYWKNEGNLTFTPSTIKNVTIGRWITMDAGDYDGDGDLDIILGNADFRIGDIPIDLKNKWENYSPSILLLKNKLR